MKILYDHQAFTGLRYGGVARYFYELMQGIDQHPDMQCELEIWFSNNEYLKNADFSKHKNFSHFLSYASTNKLMSFLNRLNSITHLRKQNFDIFHPTFYHEYFLNHIGSKPFVVTFHDTTNEKYHHLYRSLGGDMSHLKQILLDKSTKIIAVSEATKQDILAYFKVDEAKVKVVYHGTNFIDFKHNAAPQLYLPDCYLLYVGNRSDFKNFLFFLKSVAVLLKKYPDLHLVCAGGGSFTPSEKQQIVHLKLEAKVKFMPIINDNALAEMYQRATAFVFPSLNEGFGIPIIEAFASHCPVVASNTSCFLEIAGDAALYFDPTKASAIIETLEIALNNSTLCQELVAKGKQRVELFTIKNMVENTAKVYASV